MISSPVLLRQGASLSESAWGQEHLYYLDWLSGLTESGEAFIHHKLLHAIASPFLPPLYPLTGMTLRFINSFFMTSAFPSGRERGPGKSNFLVRGPLHRLGLSFVSLPFAFSRLKICVLPLCMRLEFLLLPPSPWLFRCFCFPLDLGTVGKVSCQEGCTSPTRLSELCMGTLSSIPSLMSQSLHCCTGKRKRSSKSRKRQSTSGYWLSHASTEQHTNPERFSRGRCCPVLAPVTLGHWCTSTSGCDTHAGGLRERT